MTFLLIATFWIAAIYLFGRLFGVKWERLFR